MSLQPTKTAAQIEAMRKGGRILAQILQQLRDYVQPGMTGRELDAQVEQWIRAAGATPTYLEPEVDFPGSICISVNHALVHGIPNDTPFEAGDVVGFDLTITYKQMKVDSAFTMVVGAKPTGAVRHLLVNTERALLTGIEQVRPGAHVGDISAAIEKHLTKARLSVIRDLVGHGVGQEMHMPPEIPNYGRRGSGPVIDVGDTLAIEPMASLGGHQVRNTSDGWTVAMADGSLAAHFEHTVLATDDGYEVLTLLN